MLAIVIGTFAAWSQQSGSISGKVTDEKGKDYKGSARVMAMLVPEKPEGFTPFVTNAIAASDGSYKILGLPAGKYEICVQALDGDYVDLCRWGTAAATPLVAAGRDTAVNLKLTAGKVVTIAVEDSEGLLGRHEDKSPGGFLMVGVFTPQREVIDATILQDNKVTRVYRVVVPPNVKFKIRANSPLFDMVGANEALEPLRVTQDLEQSVADAEKGKAFQVKIQGLKKVNLQ